MCFAPQRRALFRHRNFQKWSDHGVSLYILTWKCASRHSGVHFFDISTSKSGPLLWCFVTFHLEMCFAPQRRAIFPFLIWPAGSAPAALASLLYRPSGATNHWKNTVNRDFPIFSRIYIFFLLIDSSHLCFSTVHIVGSIASKPPSIICKQPTIFIIFGMGWNHQQLSYFWWTV